MSAPRCEHGGEYSDGKHLDCMGWVPCDRPPAAPDVAERIAQAIEADQERDARWTVYSLGVSNGLRRAAAIAREHKETQQLGGGK